MKLADDLSDKAGARRRRVVAALAQRVSSGLHLGLLSYGDRLPSTRVVGREFSVDPRVALAAYRVLEDRGMVELRPRSGIYVSSPGGVDKSFPFAHSTWLVDMLAEAIRNGVPAHEFSNRVHRSIDTLRLRAVVIECNDDQLFSVSDELERDYGMEVTALDLDTTGNGLPVDARRADCVVTTSAHAEAARRIAQAIGVPVLILSMCEDLFSEVRRLLEEQTVYFVVTDIRFKSKLECSFEGAPGSANLRVLVNGHDDIGQIPVAAPAYLTRLARKNIGSLPLLERLIPEAHVFNESSIRQVLEFIVRANHAVLKTRLTEVAVGR